MAVAFAETMTHQSVRPALDNRVQKQLVTYWRVRITKTVERLEADARRMLALEEQLTAFADIYYEAVGEAAGRLAELEEEQNESQQATAPCAAELEEASLYRESKTARAQEIKSRYRMIAKEIHPDRAMVLHSSVDNAQNMQSLNEAYRKGDLAALLRLEAQMHLTQLYDANAAATTRIEMALYEVNRAADTYANSYRELLNSPMNELMLRAMSARMEGWDFVAAVVKGIEKTIGEKQLAKREIELAVIASQPLFVPLAAH